MPDLHDALDVAANLLSIAVVVGFLVLWILGRNPLVVRALRADRRRTVGVVLQQAGMSRSAVRRAVKDCTRRYAHGDRAPSTQAELDWLDGLAPLCGGPVPVAFHGLPGFSTDVGLSALSDAYRRLGLRMSSRGLLGGGTTPLLEGLAEVSHDLSRHLASNATFAAGRPGEVTRLDLTVQQGTADLELSHLRPRDAPGGAIDDLAVTHVPERLVVPGTLSEKVAALDRIATVPLTLRQSELDDLDRLFQGKTFDGVLPSIREARVERDPASGRTRLHYVLAETSFSAVMASHYVGASGIGRERSALSGEARLFTLAILPSTSDGFFVLTKRTEHVSVTAGQVSPAVTGNLEMRDRTGLPVDRDPHGFPDPLLSITRECREELGIEIARDQVEVIGTVKFSSPQEVGTTVLLTTAALDLTLQEVADASRRADRIEGAWESDDQVEGVPVPRSTQEWCDLLAWSMSNQGHVPHLGGSFLAYAYPLLVTALGRDAAEAKIRELAARPDQAPPPSGIVQVVPR